MKRTLLLIVAAMVCGGCHNQGQSNVDPFFGRTTVPPPATGSVGAKPGTPSYQQPQLPQLPAGGTLQPIPQLQPGAMAPSTVPGGAAGAMTAPPSGLNPGATAGARPGSTFPPATGWGLTPLSPGTTATTPVATPTMPVTASPTPFTASPTPISTPMTPITTPAPSSGAPAAGSAAPTGSTPSPGGAPPAGFNYRGTATEQSIGGTLASSSSAPATVAGSTIPSIPGSPDSSPSIVRIPAGQENTKALSPDRPAETLADRRPIVRTLQPRPRETAAASADGSTTPSATPGTPSLAAGSEAPRDIMDLPQAGTAPTVAAGQGSVRE